MGKIIARVLDNIKYNYKVYGVFLILFVVFFGVGFASGYFSRGKYISHLEDLIKKDKENEVTSDNITNLDNGTFTVTTTIKP